MTFGVSDGCEELACLQCGQCIQTAVLQRLSGILLALVCSNCVELVFARGFLVEFAGKLQLNLDNLRFWMLSPLQLCPGGKNALVILLFLRQRLNSIKSLCDT